jgi:hypothetical protein
MRSYPDTLKSIFLYASLLPGAALVLIGFFAFGTAMLDWCRGGAVPVVYLDNFSGQDLDIHLQGKLWRSCPSESGSMVSLAAGTYTLVVRPIDGDRELDRLEVRLEYGKKYVFNALGSQRYEKYEIAYFVGGGGQMPRQTGFNDQKWFETDADYVFEIPPKTILLPKGLKSETKRVLKRLSGGEKEELTRIIAESRRHAEEDLRAIGIAYRTACQRPAVRTPEGVFVKPMPPRSLGELPLERFLGDKYSVVWEYAGIAGNLQANHRLAWERQPQIPARRLVLMGDFVTVREMTPEEFVRVSTVTSAGLNP